MNLEQERIKKIFKKFDEQYWYICRKMKTTDRFSYFYKYLEGKADVLKEFLSDLEKEFEEINFFFV